jgi:sugar phosphate isomerase/epimerase
VTLHSRRQFLASLGVGALGLAGINAASSCAANSAGAAGSRKLSKLGLQLYTVRNLMQQDMSGTLAQVAAAGYKEVEFAGYFGRSADQVRQLLAQNGLTSPSSHLQFDPFNGDPTQVLAFSKAIGNEWATIPYIPEERRKTMDDWKRITDMLNRIGAQAKNQGLRLAYHNHNFELADMGGGQRPLDFMLSNTDPSLVDFEMDLYWVVFGGGQPIEFFNKYPGRFPMVHVKDSAGPPDNKMADVGKGTINFPAIFALSDKAGIKHYFVERDDATDELASIRNSAQYLANLTY